MTLVGESNLTEQERKSIEKYLHEDPEKLTLKIRVFIQCYICNRRIYPDEFDGKEPVYLVKDRKKHYLCNLCTSLIELTRKR